MDEHEKTFTAFNVYGGLISKEEFVESYSKMYYFFNSYDTEMEIETIYSKGYELTSEEIVKFLRWKVGDKENGDTIRTQYGLGISADKVKKLVGISSQLNNDRDTKSLYEKILQQSIENIGGVYTLALISLFKKGEEPIYDRYAEVALDAVTNGTRLRDSVNYVELPEKKKVDEIFNRYSIYIGKLTMHFGSDWKTNRDIDRALWTYGHLYRL